MAFQAHQPPETRKLEARANALHTPKTNRLVCEEHHHRHLQSPFKVSQCMSVLGLTCSMEELSKETKPRHEDSDSFCPPPLFNELQTHTNLHSPVWIGPKGGCSQRESTNLGVFVPIGWSLPLCEGAYLAAFVLCHFDIRTHTGLRKFGWVWSLLIRKQILEEDLLAIAQKFLCRNPKDRQARHCYIAFSLVQDGKWGGGGGKHEIVRI